MKKSRAGRIDEVGGPTTSDPWQGRGPVGRDMHVSPSQLLLGGEMSLKQKVWVGWPD